MFFVFGVFLVKILRNTRKTISNWKKLKESPIIRDMEGNTSRIRNITKDPGLFCLFISAIVEIIGLVLRLVSSWSRIADIDPYVLCICANLQKMKEGIISFSFYASLSRLHWLWSKLYDENSYLCSMIKGTGTGTALAFLASLVRGGLW